MDPDRETGSLGGDEESWEPQQEMHALAVFSAHIEYDVGGTWEFEDGPERVALDEALAWGRQRAAAGGGTGTAPVDALSM